MKFRLSIRRVWSTQFIRPSMLGVLCFLSLTMVGHGQTLYGSIVGNVTDKSGAALADATVKIANKATNQVRETTTNTEGSFSFATVQTGVWDITVGKPGFKTLTTTNLEI